MNAELAMRCADCDELYTGSSFCPRCKSSQSCRAIPAPRSLKLAIAGPARAGKDATAEYLCSVTRLRGFRSCSDVILDKIMEGADPGTSREETFANRVHHRQAWLEAGSSLCADDPLYLVKTVLKNNDIVTGVRRHEEIVRIHQVADLSIYVHRNGCTDSTLSVSPDDCDIVINNNGSLEDLQTKLFYLAHSLGVCTIAKPALSFRLVGGTRINERKV